jgi:hypothetical protein
MNVFNNTRAKDEDTVVIINFVLLYSLLMTDRRSRFSSKQDNSRKSWSENVKWAGKSCIMF